MGSSMSFTITNNSYGIVLKESSFNDVHRNNLTYNDHGSFFTEYNHKNKNKINSYYKKVNENYERF